MKQEKKKKKIGWVTQERKIMKNNKYGARKKITESDKEKNENKKNYKECDGLCPVFWWHGKRPIGKFGRKRRRKGGGRRRKCGKGGRTNKVRKEEGKVARPEWERRQWMEVKRRRGEEKEEEVNRRKEKNVGKKEEWLKARWIREKEKRVNRNKERRGKAKNRERQTHFTSLSTFTDIKYSKNRMKWW